MTISNTMKIKQQDGSFKEVKISYIEPNYCTAEGKNTTATGEAAHAEGYGTDSILFNNITLVPYNIENNKRNFLVETGNASKGTILLIPKTANTYEIRKVIDIATVNVSSETKKHIKLNEDLSYSSANQQIVARVQRSNGALGDYSHTEGQNTLSLGKGSHAEGIGTFTADNYQHVQGKYNDDPTGYLHVVGNGENVNRRSNAHTLDWDGNAWFAGNITFGQAEYKVPKIQTEEYHIIFSDYDTGTYAMDSTSHLVLKSDKQQIYGSFYLTNIDISHPQDSIYQIGIFYETDMRKCYCPNCSFYYMDGTIYIDVKNLSIPLDTDIKITHTLISK